MKRLASMIGIWMVAMAAVAVVATSEPVLRRLPDGTMALVRLCGDENYSYLMRMDGSLIEDSQIGGTAESVAMQSSARKGASATMIGGYVPASGVVKIPVILVGYSDFAFTLEDAKAKFEDLYNGNGGSNPKATGSVAEYYRASSNNALQLQFDVYGPYTLSKTQAYYGANSGSSHTPNGRDLVLDAARLAAAAGVNLSQYDNDGDGYVDNLSIITAGYNEAEGGSEDCIWPHYSSLNSSEMFSGVKVRGYLMTSEYRSSGGSIQCGIGTYCHEFGHALGLPDLYDTNDSKAYTVGHWDIMCNGSYNNNGCTPPTFTAFERFMMGWLTPTQLKLTNNYLLEPIETSNTAYLITDADFNGSNMSPNPSEYFLLENRQMVGWDAGKEALVASGLLVSHITFSSSNWNNNKFNNNTPLGFDIVEAGIVDATSSTASDVFPGVAKVTSWLPTLNNGTQLLDQKLLNITQQSSGAISFHYGVNLDKGFFFSEQSLPLLTTTYDNGRAVAYDTAYVELTVKKVDSDSLSITTESEYFDLSLDSGATWITGGKTYKTEVLKDSTYVIGLWLRHAPRRQSCTTRSCFLTAVTTDGAYVNQLEMTGWAPRPTYIETPTISGCQDVSSSTVTVIWEPQEDAESYYVTMFSMKDNASTDSESFETFSSKSAIESAGWSSNFVEQTQSVSKSGKAMYFTSTGQQLVTKTYLAPPSEITFWISTNYVTSSTDSVTGGRLLIEASSGNGEWTTLDNIRLVRTTKNLDKSYTLNADDAFVLFRLTYTHLGGTGGMGLDDFSAHLEKEIHYVCKGLEREMQAPTSRIIFTGLSAGTTYYCQVQAYENKGCEEHLTALSKAYKVTTLADSKGEQLLDITRLASGVYVADLPQSSDGTSVLYVFSYDGRIVGQVKIPYGATSVEVPTEGLVPYTYYVLKVVDGRMKRRDAKGKILYY